MNDVIEIRNSDRSRDVPMYVYDIQAVSNYFHIDTLLAQLFRSRRRFRVSSYDWAYIRRTLARGT